MPLPLLPDVIALIRDAWLAQSSVTALVSTRIYDRIPASATSTDFPLVELIDVDDDEASDAVHGLSRVQNSIWGQGPSPANTQQARLIARTMRAAARDLKGTYSTGTIYACTPALFIPQPDPATGRARFILDTVLEIA